VAKVVFPAGEKQSSNEWGAEKLKMPAPSDPAGQSSKEYRISVTGPVHLTVSIA